MSHEPLISWSFVLETLLKWFIPVLAAGVGGFIFVKLRNIVVHGNQQVRQEEWDKHAVAVIEEIKTNKENSDAQDKALNKRMDKMDNDIALLTKSNRLQNLRGLQRGGRELLNQKHISTAEYRQFEEEYQTYKECGGDGWADDIREAVRQKYQIDLSDYKKNGDTN